MYWKKRDKHPQQTASESQNAAVFDTFFNNTVNKVDSLFDQISNPVNAKKIATYTATGLLLLWGVSGIYIVDEGNQGVVTRFGAYHETTDPGPHWHLPYPIEAATVLNVANQRFIELGYNSASVKGNNSILGESLMLTEDENIVDVRLAVQYQIKNARDYLFNVEDQLATLKQATQSAERAVIGKNHMDFVLTEGRSSIVAQIQDQIQSIMDGYKAGVVITSVNLQDAQPPEQVQAAFEEAIKAREDKQRLINEAEAYANEKVPTARGNAARKLQEAEAYKQNVIATATGDISRFNQLYAEYKKSPQVTRKRLLIETMESVLDESDVVMMDTGSNTNMVYLPLDRLHKNTPANGKNTTTSPFPAASEALPSESSDSKFKHSNRGRN